MEIVFDDSPFVQLRFSDLMRVEKLRALGFRITFCGWNKSDTNFHILAENMLSKQAFKFFFSSYEGMMTWARGEKFRPDRIRRFFVGGEEDVEEMCDGPSAIGSFGRLLDVEG